MRPTTTLWNFGSWGSWRLGSPGHIIILWAAPKSGKTFPHSLNPACHNNSNRAGWSAENWKLKTENWKRGPKEGNSHSRRCSFPLLADTPSTSLWDSFRFIHLFVASCFSFILNFRRFNSAFELLSFFSDSVSVFPILRLAVAQTASRKLNFY